MSSFEERATVTSLVKEDGKLAKNILTFSAPCEGRVADCGNI